MIKFFRNIRKKLLQQGKFVNYLKYAIGEILLVVIGILIALQVNNWNEKRKDRVIELAFIKGLITDLKADLKTLDDIIGFNEAKLSTIDSLLAFAGTDINSMPDHNQLYWMMRRGLLSGAPFQNQNQNLERLPNFSNNLVRPRVTDSIALFQHQLAVVNTMSEEYLKVHNDIWQIIPRLFKLYQLNNKEYYDWEQGKLTGKLFSRINEDKLLQDEFFSRVAFVQAATENYLSEKRFLKKHVKATQNLITFLESEYKLSYDQILPQHPQKTP